MDKSQDNKMCFSSHYASITEIPPFKTFGKKKPHITTADNSRNGIQFSFKSSINIEKTYTD